jgi:hypothetical protein
LPALHALEHVGPQHGFASAKWGNMEDNDASSSGTAAPSTDSGAGKRQKDDFKKLKPKIIPLVLDKTKPDIKHFLHPMMDPIAQAIFGVDELLEETWSIITEEEIKFKASISQKFMEFYKPGPNKLRLDFYSEHKYRNALYNAEIQRDFIPENYHDRIHLHYCVIVGHRFASTGDVAVPEVNILFMNLRNDFSGELLRKSTMFDMKGEVFSSKFNIYELNLDSVKLIAENPDAYSPKLKMLTYFCIFGNKPDVFLQLAESIGDVDALASAKNYAARMHDILGTPVIIENGIKWANDNGYILVSDETRDLPMVQLVYEKMLDEKESLLEHKDSLLEQKDSLLASIISTHKKDSMDKCIMEKKRNIASVLRLLAKGVSNDVISESLGCSPLFISKLNASMTVDEAYDIFMRDTFSYCLYLLDSGASVDEAAETADISKALIEKLKANRYCYMTAEGFAHCKEIAWFF